MPERASISNTICRIVAHLTQETPPRVNRTHVRNDGQVSKIGNTLICHTVAQCVYNRGMADYKIKYDEETGDLFIAIPKEFAEFLEEAGIDSAPDDTEGFVEILDAYIEWEREECE